MRVRKSVLGAVILLGGVVDVAQAQVFSETYPDNAGNVCGRTFIIDARGQKRILTPNTGCFDNNGQPVPWGHRSAAQAPQQQQYMPPPGQQIIQPPVRQTQRAASPFQAGWAVSVLEADQHTERADENGPDMFVFAAPIGPIRRNAHMSQMSITNNVAYRGVATFRASQAGAYSFLAQITLLPNNHSNHRPTCHVSMRIQDTQVLSRRFEGQSIRQESERSVVAFGQQQLDSGEYTLSYFWSCAHNQYAAPNLQLRILVRRPGQSQPGDFQPAELFYRVGG